jgi:hypothetical protein
MGYDPVMAVNTRQSVLPMEHLDAELLAAPFASRIAFRHSLVTLDHVMRGGTETLWRETERELLEPV